MEQKLAEIAREKDDMLSLIGYLVEKARKDSNAQNAQNAPNDSRHNWKNRSRANSVSFDSMIKSIPEI
jgi:hypothetical protein